MAKSARASVRKRNNQALRKTIFGPAHDARTERLSAKLQELAAQPKPETVGVIELKENDDSSKEQTEEGVQNGQGMDIDTIRAPLSLSAVKKNKSARIEKKVAKRKPRNRVVFPTSVGKQKRVAQSKKKAV